LGWASKPQMDRRPPVAEHLLLTQRDYTRPAYQGPAGHLVLTAKPGALRPGLPLGIPGLGLASCGPLAHAQKVSFRQHILLWGWTGGYFCPGSRWLSMPPMRYPAPVIPAWPSLPPGASPTHGMWPAHRAGLAVSRGLKFAHRHTLETAPGRRGWLYSSSSPPWPGPLAFTPFTPRPLTRVAASDLIYQNLPGPMNVRLQTSSGPDQPNPCLSPMGRRSSPARLIRHLCLELRGELDELFLAHVLSLLGRTAVAPAPNRAALSTSAFPACREAQPNRWPRPASRPTSAPPRLSPLPCLSRWPFRAGVPFTSTSWRPTSPAA